MTDQTPQVPAFLGISSIWHLVIPLCVLAGIFGLIVGRHVSGLTETDVINAAAADYVAANAVSGITTQATDCAARPDAGLSNWLVVTCQPPQSSAHQIYEYSVNKWGQIVRLIPL